MSYCLLYDHLHPALSWFVLLLSHKQDLLRFLTILKLHQPQCTMGDLQILHQGLVQGGLGRLGYLITILPQDILWNLQFHMQLEVCNMCWYIYAF